MTDKPLDSIAQSCYDPSNRNDPALLSTVGVVSATYVGGHTMQDHTPLGYAYATPTPQENHQSFVARPPLSARVVFARKGGAV